MELSLGLASGIEFMHRCKILHNDLKENNVLIACSEKPVPKIIDFGKVTSVDHPKVYNIRPSQCTIPTLGL